MALTVLYMPHSLDSETSLLASTPGVSVGSVLLAGTCTEGLPDVISLSLSSGRLSGRGTTRTEDAQGTPTQSHMSTSILVYEESNLVGQNTISVVCISLSSLNGLYGEPRFARVESGSWVLDLGKGGEY